MGFLEVLYLKMLDAFSQGKRHLITLYANQKSKFG